MNQTPDNSPAAATMEEFFTRQRANEGIDLPLSLPDGSPTAHWLKIRGVDSDAFKVADAEARRKLLEAAGHDDKSKLNDAMTEGRLNTLAALVISWSFPQACTMDNVKKFLREAPQIADAIDRLSTKRSLFFKKGSPNSTPSPAQSSS